MTALSRAHPDHVVRLPDLPALLARLVQEPEGKPIPIPDWMKFEVEIARNGGFKSEPMDKIRHLDNAGRRSALACPDCGGVMWEVGEGDIVRYRCHVGHAYTDEMMSPALDQSLRRALASAMRALEERIALARSLQKQATDKGRMLSAGIWAARAQEYEREANVIRSSMTRADKLAAQFAKMDSSAAQ
jgi:two-component system, chemotaxis family, protein-glutamate methylesterase/glutaminase